MFQTLKAAYALLAHNERKRAMLVFALMLATAFFELVGVGSILPFLAIVTDPAIIDANSTLATIYAGLGFKTHTGFILFLGSVVLGFLVLTNAVTAVGTWAQLRFVESVGHGLSVRLMKKYLEKPHTYFLTHNSSALGKNILSETSRVVAGALKPGMTLVAKTLVAMAIIGLLISVEPLITISFVLLIGGIYSAIYLLIRRRLQRIGRKAVEANRQRFKATSEAFGGIKDVKVLGQEWHFLEAYAGASKKYAGYNASKQIYSELPRYLLHSIAFGGMMAIFLVLVGSGMALTRIVPVMGFFAFAGYRLMPAFQEILRSLAQLRYNDHIVELVHKEVTTIEAEERMLHQDRERLSALPFRREIRLEQVSYSYPATSIAVLKDIDLVIPKNASIAFVGSTGAGKTTLVDILLGLLHPRQGRLLVDGTVITPQNASNWQKNIGYVPQEIFLTDDTVRNNIAFGIPAAQIDEGSVIRAAKTAQIHDFIATELPEGYDTIVGERGIRLSGGQRQRIGIARALYHNPPVLMLDEATSDIDNITEAHITRAIETLAGQKTFIVVAHRLSTIRSCDVICLVDKGEIVAKGSFKELEESDERFRLLSSGISS